MFQSTKMYCKYHKKKKPTPELKNTWISIKTKYTDKIQIYMHTCIFSAVLKLLDKYLKKLLNGTLISKEKNKPKIA